MTLATAQRGTPINGMNTTPLIDVMLVLLVMFIITIPIQTHKVSVDLPRPGPQGEILDVNTIGITGGGTVLWNGTPVSFVQLQGNLSRASARTPVPELRFEPDANARFGLVDSVLALIRRSGSDTLGFVGNERYASAF